MSDTTIVTLTFLGGYGVIIGYVAYLLARLRRTRV